MKTKLTSIAGLVCGILIGIYMVGCGQNTGKTLGTAWVVHNSATQTMISLGEAEVVDVDVLKEFNSYQSPVLEGLDAATEDYLDGDDSTDEVDMILDFIGPMLDRMVTLTKEADDE